ncbi:XdhC family protein [Novosphingobium sp.]|uniref:XdhC family protein n=1 Tax=Novosphingobium sp. TaxID=1874826 RepID=UPI0027337B62|nr:XdhC family protein [Novosphingobium sp.]MDP3908562.1 XdhC family protein [Novosphingobium sp.]
MDQRRIFEFLTERMAAGKRCVLVTVLAVQGSAMRNPGTHMAVCGDGSFVGSLSGGCIENAVVAEACEALTAGQPRIVRFGAGSPYLDIRLPCGGGLDIHFQPLADEVIARECLAAIDARQPYTVAFRGQGAECIAGWHPAPFNPADGTASFGHFPQARLMLVGHGEGVSALALLARALALDVAVLTPDERALERLQGLGFPVAQLVRTTDTALLHSDPWTAIVFLFHDHDWEIALLRRAFELPHFYIGAMGGRRANAARCEALLAAGVSASAVATLHAPIGLFHSSRDPDTLALSALAEIVRVYQDTDFGAALG